MTFFAAMLSHRSHVDDGGRSSNHLCEETLIVVEADSLILAEAKAKMLGKQREHCYKNNDDRQVTWTFDRVEKIQELSGEMLMDGMEIFNRFLRERELEGLRSRFD